MERDCKWPRKKIISRHSKKKAIAMKDVWVKVKRLLALAIILVSVYAVFVSDAFEVKNIKLSGNSQVKSDEIEKFIFDSIHKSRIYPEIKGDMFLISGGSVAGSMLENFKIFRNVVISKKIPNDLEIFIQEKNITTVWCRASCYWLDEEGAVFKPFAGDQINNIDTGNVTMVLDNDNSPMKTGDKITDKNFLLFAGIIRKALKEELNLDFDNIKTPGVITDEVWVQTRQNWMILFNVKGDAEDEIRLLKQILKEKITPEELKNLEYIDLRIKGKVFYRTKK